MVFEICVHISIAAGHLIMNTKTFFFLCKTSLAASSPQKGNCIIISLNDHIKAKLFCFGFYR